MRGVAAIGEAEISLGGFTMTATAAGGELVTGLLDRANGEEDIGLSGSGILIDFAEFLTMNACNRLTTMSEPGQVVQCGVNLYVPAPALARSGECRIVKISDTLVASTTEIRNDEGRLIAIVTQTVALPAGSQDHDTDDAASPNDAGHDKVIPLGQAENGKMAKLAEVDIPAVRRQQIFNAAVKVITNKGFERSTIREITREAGLTIPTIYQYFKRKDDILELIFDTYIQKVETDLKAAIASQNTAKARLEAAVHVTLASLHKYHREILILSQETKSLRPEVKRAVIRKMMRYLSNFVEIVESGVQTGEFRTVEAELYANLIPMMCQVWIQRYWSVGKFGLKALEKAVLDLAIRGLEK